MNLKLLFTIHGIVTLAAGIALIVAPAAIPGVVGIQLPRDAYFICYLLAASELALSFLSFASRNISDSKALGVIVMTNIVLHASSALLEVYAYSQGLSGAIRGNVALRVVVVGLFWYYGLRKKNTLV